MLRIASGSVNPGYSKLVSAANGNFSHNSHCQRKLTHVCYVMSKVPARKSLNQAQPKTCFILPNLWLPNSGTTFYHFHLIWCTLLSVFLPYIQGAFFLKNVVGGNFHYSFGTSILLKLITVAPRSWLRKPRKHISCVRFRRTFIIGKGPISLPFPPRSSGEKG